MGCSSSASKVAPIKQKEDDDPQVITEIPQPTNPNELDKQMRKSFLFLTNRIHSIRFPSGMVPILVLSNQACPLYLSKMEFALEKSDLHFPIIAYTYPKAAKIICFSHYMILANSYFRNEDTKTIIYNCFQWLFPQMTPKGNTLFCIGFPDHILSDVENQFTLLNYSVKFGTFDDDWEQYSVLAVTSTLPIYEDSEKISRLSNYLRKGNGLACFYDSTESLFDVPINPFLSQYGLSYAYCQLVNEMNPSPTLKAPKDYYSLTSVTFDSLVTKLRRNLAKLKAVKIDKLDSIVTRLRYHVMVCQKEQLPKLKEILEMSFDFLQNTNYRNDDKIVFKSYQLILIILMIDVFKKMPIDEIRIANDADLFPGLVENMPLSDHTVTIRCRPNSIVSTGIWCQPGVVSTIECNNAPDNVEVQIGSHNSVLVTQPGPWHRWPDITTTYKLEKGQTSVATSFGGIVYILNGGTSLFDLELKFHNFSKYTRIVPSKPGIYESTKESNAPMCELILQTVIFTIPSSFIPQIDNMNELFLQIDNLINQVAKISYYKIVRPYRIVFDTDLTEDLFVDQYPIVLHIQDLPDIFTSELTVNGGLFRMLMAIAVSSLRENCFDRETERALGAFIASSVFLQMKPDFDPLTFFEVDLSLLYTTIWNIHIHINNQLIPGIIEESQKMEIEQCKVPEDLWINFVEKLCKLTQYNLSKVLGSIRPIPLNVMAEMEELPLPPDNFFT